MFRTLVFFFLAISISLESELAHSASAPSCTNRIDGFAFSFMPIEQNPEWNLNIVVGPNSDNEQSLSLGLGSQTSSLSNTSIKYIARNANSQPNEVTGELGDDNLPHTVQINFGSSIEFDNVPSFTLLSDELLITGPEDCECYQLDSDRSQQNQAYRYIKYSVLTSNEGLMVSQKIPKVEVEYVLEEETNNGGSCVVDYDFPQVILQDIGSQSVFNGRIKIPRFGSANSIFRNIIGTVQNAGAPIPAYRFNLKLEGDINYSIDVPTNRLDASGEKINLREYLLETARDYDRKKADQESKRSTSGFPTNYAQVTLQSLSIGEQISSEQEIESPNEFLSKLDDDADVTIERIGQ